MADDVPALVRRLGSSSKADQVAAAGALQRLADAGGAASQAAIAGAGALPALVRLLSGDAWLAAGLALASLVAHSPDNAAALVEAGVQAPLLQYLRAAPADAEMLSYSSILMGVIATYGRNPHCVARNWAAREAESMQDDAAGLLVAMWGLENLVLYLQCPWGGHLDLALTALARLLQNGDAQERQAMARSLLDKGVLEHVLPLMGSRDPSVREAAATAVVLLGVPAGSAAAPQTPAQPPAAAPPPTPPRAPRTCATPGCGTTHGLRRCGGCRTVRYCSESCSRANWQAHKAECRRVQAERSAVPPASGEA